MRKKNMVRGSLLTVSRQASMEFGKGQEVTYKDTDAEAYAPDAVTSLATVGRNDDK